MEEHNLKYIEGKVAWLLDNICTTRNLKNMDFVFAYWEYYFGLKIPEYMRRDLTDPESVRRVKQKLVESAPKKYGPFDKNVLDAKFISEEKFRDYVT